MRFAEVVVALPVEGPFDYSIPEELENLVKEGSRVKVNFNNRKLSAYVIKIKEKSDIKITKPILSVLDDKPLINLRTFSLAYEFSAYYGCSLGEAIETFLPEAIKKSRKVLVKDYVQRKSSRANLQAVAFAYSNEKDKWDFYLKEINLVLKESRQVIVIFSQVSYIREFRERFKQFKDNIALLHSYQTGTIGLENWRKIKDGTVSIVLGTMSAVFAPLPNLGLLIIDEESSDNYKQRQSPFYHVRTVAFMRSRIDSAKVLLADKVFSLETAFGIKQKEISFVNKLFFNTDNFKFNIINLSEFNSKGLIISPFLENRLSCRIKDKEKSLVFFNRKGYSTILRCDKCDFILRCERCSAGLIFDKQKNRLICHLCLSVYPVPEICPNCKKSYMHYKGVGIEKVSSRLKQLFPQARIIVYDVDTAPDALANSNFDIMVGTSSVLNIKPAIDFKLTAVLGLDYLLNLPDFRNSEKIFNLLVNLRMRTSSEMILETSYPRHHAIKFLKEFDIEAFNDYELSQRSEFGLPPFKHVVNIILRSKIESSVKEKADILFKSLLSGREELGLELFEPAPKNPYKLRNSYYWQIVVKCPMVRNCIEYLKKNIRNFSHSQVIITIDVDAL